MTDRLSKEERSKLMSKILSKGSKMELKMMAALESSNIRFEYQPKIYGRPDFFIQPSIAVFCDSSFWHGRDWTKLKKQLTKDYWLEHINRNRKRDRVVNRTLKNNGYIVLRFWEEEVMKKTDDCIARIKRAQQTSLGSQIKAK